MADRITKRTVDGAEPGTVDRFLWDPELKGFGLKVTPHGRKVFQAQYRLRGQRQSRRMTIGAYGPLTVDQARAEARRILGEAASGRDPAEERRPRSVTDFATVFEDFLADHADAKRKPRTAVEYRRLARIHLLPRFGRLSVTDLDRAHVAKLHREMADAPYQANRTLALLSKFCNWCEMRELRPEHSNPCRHVEKYREEKRERFLSGEELLRLGNVLAELEYSREMSPWAIGAVRLLMFTGARLSEVLTLKWQHVNFERRLLLLADSKTGKKVVYINPAAQAVLEGLPRLEGNPFVICGRTPGRHLINLEKPWRLIRSRAGLDDVRLHDLRHSFAAVAAGQGLSLPMIGKLLGHSQPQTTARYAHLAADPVQEANLRIGEEIARALGSQVAKGPGSGPR